MRPENELKKQLKALKTKLSQGQGLEDFQKITDDIVGDAANYNDEAFNEVAIRFHSLYTELSETRAAGNAAPDAFFQRFDGAVSAYLQN